MSTSNLDEILQEMLIHARDGNVVDLANQIQALERLAKGNIGDLLYTLNIKDVEGRTALHLAAASNDKDSVELLIKKGAYIDAQDMNGNLPIHFAALYGATQNLVIIANTIPLLRFIDKPNKEGFTPLHYAALNGNVNCIYTLISNGADPGKQSSTGSTPLSIALNSKAGLEGFLHAQSKIFMENYVIDNGGNHLITKEEFNESGYGSDIDAAGKVKPIVGEY